MIALERRLRKSASGKIETLTEGHAPLVTAQTVQPEQRPQEPAKPEKNLSAIKAPMVGTFYRSPGTDAKSYVEIGQTVEIGQVVCIIEAMKLMNEIKSEVKGKVIEILVENARSIEYGQALFMLEPL